MLLTAKGDFTSCELSQSHRRLFPLDDIWYLSDCGNVGKSTCFFLDLLIFFLWVCDHENINQLCLKSIHLQLHSHLFNFITFKSSTNLFVCSIVDTWYIFINNKLVISS